MRKIRNSCKSLTLLTILALLCNPAAAKFGNELRWPTPNTAYLEKLSPEAYLQATESGRIDSGRFGCSRNQGQVFHEGVDLRAVLRTADGVAQDQVCSIADGRVVHLNRDVELSNYGKYIVISHFRDGLEWCSLYAHLRAISPSLQIGQVVHAGDNIGVMGNSSSSIDIPEERAHLHFEIVMRNTSRFDDWYQKQKFSTPNDHGSWNGMNLIGTDPFAFYDYFLDHPRAPFTRYFLEQPIAFRAMVYFRKHPDFLVRNPVFLRGRHLKAEPGWYQVGFTWYGLPTDWRPIDSSHVDRRLDSNSIYINEFKHEKSCRNWVDISSQQHPIPTSLLLRHLSILKTGDNN